MRYPLATAAAAAAIATATLTGCTSTTETPSAGGTSPSASPIAPSVSLPPPTVSSEGDQVLVAVDRATCSLSASALVCTSPTPMKVAVDGAAAVQRSIVVVGALPAGQRLALDQVAPDEAPPGALVLPDAGYTPIGVVTAGAPAPITIELVDGSTTDLATLFGSGRSNSMGRWKAPTGDWSTFARFHAAAERASDGAVQLRVQLDGKSHTVALRAT
ncbi:hypothetical protein [Tsukamurella ocularis]|uniref:hypothetical protein n=1 Tax=Tsukamurella ocularis TaxID=1970234 RepID=UPI0021696E2D|nr:hypothetical protein [Tsukamurella ocularis]MCS3853289.1 hypothetical protein [Tsukamurella ocularis]